MLKFAVIIILVIIFSACNQNLRTNTKKNETISKISIDDNSLVYDKGQSPLDIYLKTFSDSIEIVAMTDFVPAFLGDAQFDYDHAKLWAPSHHPYPMRKMILDKVKNCNSLKIIIDNGNVKYREKPVMEHNIQIKYLEFSFYDLIIKRYDELKCK